jgi:hypothetical protein
MADDLLCFQRPVNIKTKIRYNGQEYSDPKQLPPEVRAAYDKARRGDTGSRSNPVLKRNFVANGEEFSGEDEMPADARRFCEDVMSVIENNGEVTLPGSPRNEPVITKRQLALVFLVVGMLLALAWLALATG